MGKAMAYIDVLKHIKFDELSPEQRDELRSRFYKRKQDLEAAIKTIDEGLESLDKAAKG